MNWQLLPILAHLSLILAGGALGQTVHKVKEGESLWAIAKRAGITVESLKNANGITSDVVWAGADLIIPAPSAPPPRPAPPKLSPPTNTAPPQPRAQPQLQPPVAPLGTTSPPPPPRSLSGKGLGVLQLQVTLDQAGFSPGVIDGYNGKFTELARVLCEAWRPSALQNLVAPTRMAQIPASWVNYVNPSLPGSGSAPDFLALTRKQETIHYYSALEYLAERFHCSENLLKKLNPGVNLTQPQAGLSIQVPNVEAFEIERYFNAKGEGIWSGRLGKGEPGRRVMISVPDSLLTLWEGERLLRAYPITLNIDDSPRGKRVIGSVAPGPTYMRKKTKLDLLAGPNSPVGIVWCPLGNGFGIHGTSNPDSIGRNVSSGCIRMANWDAVRFAALITKGTEVIISEREKAYSGGQ